jgi:twitching motility protein PilT
MEDSVFAGAIKRGASDVHIVVGLPPIYRVDGELARAKFKAFTRPDVERLLRRVLTANQLAVFEAHHEFDFAHEEAGRRFRVNAHVERGNPALAARLIPARIPTLDDLQMPSVVRDMINDPNGLLLVTGPAGTGKSTTLAAMLGEISATRPVHLITLEDPLEFIFSPKVGVVKQREVGADTESFAEGLKHVLRQDPDVVMIGEMRDPETIATVLTLAETGHLVLSTLHTRGAPATINRIIDSFPPGQQNQVRQQLALSLRGIVSQVLLPKVGGGRVAAREILLSTPAVASLIRENKIEQISTVILTNRKAGMVSLEQSIHELIKAGMIEASVAERYTESRRH